MCGRYTLDVTSAELGQMLEGDMTVEWTPSWNIKPTQRVPVFREAVSDDGEIRRGDLARWSLLPPWATEPKLKFPTFNARSEGLAAKATWRGPIKRSRAILPARGYYEWKTDGKVKTPHYIHLSEGELLFFAGLYSGWRPKDSNDEWMLTATIITRPSAGAAAQLHDRAPVVLPADFVDEWLDPATEGDQSLVDVAVSASSPQIESLQFHEVGKISGDIPELTNPVATS